MRVILAPDSFKGSITSLEFCNVAQSVLKKYFPNCVIDGMPLGDGGEGTAQALLSVLGGKKVFVNVLNPHGKPAEAFYVLTKNGKGIAEIASSSALTMVGKEKPMEASTYGFGQLIAAMLSEDIKDITLCLGGSATTDGGAGLAAALGVKFFDFYGNIFVPNGGTLKDIAYYDAGALEKIAQTHKFTLLTDCKNPLAGKRGAAYVYSPQKGAKEEQVKLLDIGLRHYAKIIHKQSGKDYTYYKGIGAAGGAALSLKAFLGATINSGIDRVLKLYNFTKKAKLCDFVITGEGSLDSQSLMGKALSGILKAAGQKPIYSFCGISKLRQDDLPFNLKAISISLGIEQSEAIKNAPYYLERALESFIKENFGYLKTL